jgi:sugar phosphate isomerase/epimerase
MMNRLGIETISAFGLPPVQYVNLAADLGCAYISLGLSPIDINPHGYAPYNLRENAALRREVNAAMRDRGVAISLAEGLTVKPGIDARDRAAEFDAFAEMGVKRINTVSVEPDLGRTVEQFGITVEMAAERGMVSTTEFAPGLTVADLPTALHAIDQVGRPDFRLLIDTMHLIRSGSSPADLAVLAPDMIGYVQLSDVPLAPQFPSYMQEAMTERRAPGQGELPLLEILKIIPRDRVIGLEIPMLSQAKSGVGPLDRLRPAVAAARDLLARLAPVEETLQ